MTAMWTLSNNDIGIKEKNCGRAKNRKKIYGRANTIITHNLFYVSLTLGFSVQYCIHLTSDNLSYVTSVF
jgi:hypothetical protein